MAAEEVRRAMADLTADLDDARAALSHAHDRAVLAEEAAQAALEDCQRRAIILPVGRRVYLTTDGSKLYGEDQLEITQEAVVSFARDRRTSAGPSYEVFKYSLRERDDARAKTLAIADSLAAIEDIDERLRGRDLSPEDLRALREEADRLIISLPPEVREDFEQRRSDRKNTGDVAYRPADGLFDDALPLASAFRKTTAAVADPSPVNSNPDQSTVPAYRRVPDF